MNMSYDEMREFEYIVQGKPVFASENVIKYGSINFLHKKNIPLKTMKTTQMRYVENAIKKSKPLKKSICWE